MLVSVQSYDSILLPLVVIQALVINHGLPSDTCTLSQLAKFPPKYVIVYIFMHKGRNIGEKECVVKFNGTGDYNRSMHMHNYVDYYISLVKFYITDLDSGIVVMLIFRLLILHNKHS